MRERAFRQVDVFTQVPLMGNPVAVVLDAEGLDGATMQAFAAWTNLSETTFVTPASSPGADYRVRIFTPRSELPFAGHPTLGTAYAVLEAGLAAPVNDRLVQECAVGLVELSVADDWRRDGLSFKLPRHALRPAPGEGETTAWIGAEIIGTPAAVDVGPVWHVAQIADAAALEALTPDLARLARYTEAHHLTGSTLFAVKADGSLVVRSFAPGDGVPEDPVCGSGNGAVAGFRLAHGQIAAGDGYVASQGRQVGRDGRVKVRIEGGDIHVGGACVIGVTGTVRL